VSDKIRWGILSTAKIGRKVIPAIHASNNGIVAAVASRNIAAAESFAAEMNIPQAYGSYDELLASPHIDAIYIPLPNGMHHEWSLKCAAAGKHTLCEKPLADNAAQAQQMVEAFHNANLKFAEAFMYRLHPQTQRARQIIQDGSIGELKIINASFSFRIKEENDVRLQADLAGGALMDVGCYPVSLMRLITGEEPIRAEAVAVFGDASNVDEVMTGALYFPSGVVGHFDCSVRAFFTAQYEARGTHGKVFADPGFPMPPDQPTTLHHWRENDDGQVTHDTISIPAADHYQLMVEDFAVAMLNDRAPMFPGTEAVLQMRAIDMLYASAKEKI